MKKITFVRRDGFLGEREILYTGVSKVFNISSNWVLNSMNFATTAEDMDDEIIEEIESIIAGDTRDLCLSLDVEELGESDIKYLEETIESWGYTPSIRG